MPSPHRLAPPWDGLGGLEPPTSASRTRRADQAALQPVAGFPPSAFRASSPPRTRILRSSRVRVRRLSPGRGRKPKSGWPDSNRRPPVPQTGALPSCATSRSARPRRESNPDLRFRRPASCPLDHVGVVSPGGFEPPSSSLSGKRSDLLSYDDLAEGEGLEPPDDARLCLSRTVPWTSRPPFRGASYGIRTRGLLLDGQALWT